MWLQIFKVMTAARCFIRRTKMHAGFCSTEVTGSKEAILDGILSNGRGYYLTWELSEHCSQKSPLLSNVIFFSTYALNFIFGGCRGRVLLHSTDWPGTQRSTCYASQVMGLKVCIILTGSSEFLFEGIQTLHFKALPSVFPEWLLPSHSHLEKRGESLVSLHWLPQWAAEIQNL